MATWIIETITALGYAGIFLLMLLESVFPPIPSELIIPFAGYSAATGALDLWLVLLAATAGAVVGMLPWYLAGRLFGLGRVRTLADRHGRWLTLNAAEVDTATGWFRRFGPVIVLAGRLIPLIRTLISIPAGLARMPLWHFLVFSTLGAFTWNVILVGAGFILAEHYERVETWLDPGTTIVLGVVVLTYLYRIVTWRPGRLD
ncbi:MAG: DedA family protein [Devosia sp.]|uniref:DedA family protein n=1 Tax=Devosia sp. TaxID=1871048 RepID=UPI001ACF33B6|nr:DedA family protein [Devosia sp.]MBN9316701.1 DedA family protein [Devosia sp.]